MLGIVGIAGGVGLLNLRPRGRVLTECLTWLGLLYMIGFGGFWLFSMQSMGSLAGVVTPKSAILGKIGRN